VRPGAVGEGGDDFHVRYNHHSAATRLRKPRRWRRRGPFPPHLGQQETTRNQSITGRNSKPKTAGFPCSLQHEKPNGGLAEFRFPKNAPSSATRNSYYPKTAPEPAEQFRRNIESTEVLGGAVRRRPLHRARRSVRGRDTHQRFPATTPCRQDHRIARPRRGRCRDHSKGGKGGAEVEAVKTKKRHRLAGRSRLQSR